MSHVPQGVAEAPKKPPTALDYLRRALERRRSFGARWALDRIPDELPDGWTRPTHIPFILKCTAAENGEACLARLAPHVRTKYGALLCDIETIPHVVAVMTQKFAKGLGFAETPADLYRLFNGCFSERLVKELWYDVWLAAHNAAAKKDVRRAMAQKRSLGPQHNIYVSESVRHAAPRSIY